MSCLNQQQWDKKLKIQTIGRDASSADAYRYPYEPTDYCVLQRLADSGLITADNVLVDYGCGKGRVSFFLNSQIGCKVTGIDHSERLLQMAKKNLEEYGKTDDIKFIHSKAEEYVPGEAKCFYLYNPFSTKIFRQVLKRIGESKEKNPREILIFFYYSTIEYKTYLPTEPRIELIKTVTFNEETINDRVPAKLSVYRYK